MKIQRVAIGLTLVNLVLLQVLGCDDAAYEPRAVIEELDS
jgi:hypothetical protein